ncbi:hypothetical protein [Pararhodonellum marinum]|uniref:hypothetical protein n=1 Tax=Pararhodonellum marinum TaxID=2755358 RepID=UPI00188DD9CA|nr:hypothetical protein [Pararhodonellum marinum]
MLAQDKMDNYPQEYDKDGERDQKTSKKEIGVALDRYHDENKVTQFTTLKDWYIMK